LILKGWTAAVLDKKLQQLAAIIQQFNQGRGPDILGVCEVENVTVEVFHADSAQDLSLIFN
jgi:hypothetical protein